MYCSCEALAKYTLKRNTHDNVSIIITDFGRVPQEDGPEENLKHESQFRTEAQHKLTEMQNSLEEALCKLVVANTKLDFAKYKKGYVQLHITHRVAL